MIRALRNSGIGQIFLGAIVVAIILAFVLTGASPGVGGSSDDCVVEAGSHCVSPKEYEASYRLLTAIGGGSINEAAAKRLRLKEQVARGLAERELLAAEAERIGLATSEDDVDEHLLEGRTRVSLPAEDAERLALSLAMCVDGPTGCEPGTIGLRAIDVKRDGKFDIDVYKRTVRVWTRRSPAQFKEMQMREHTAERLRQLIRSQVRVSEDEAFLAMSRIRSKATARLLPLKTTWFERFVIDLDAAALERVSTAQKEALDAAKKQLEETYTDGCAVVRELRIDSADPGSEEAKQAEKTARGLALQAKVTKDLSGLARQFSSADTARIGGYVGCLDDGYGVGAAALKEAAAELTRPGQVSDPVETLSGFVVLQLVDRVTEENREELVTQHAALELASATLAAESLAEYAQAVTERAQGEVSLQEANQAVLKELLGPTIDSDAPAMTSDDVPRVEVSPAVTIDQPLIDDALPDEAAAVGLFELEQENQFLAAPVKTESGVVVVQLKSKEPFTREAFEEDRDRILKTLRSRKAEQALARFVEKLAEKAGGIKLNPKYVPAEGSDDPEQDS